MLARGPLALPCIRLQAISFGVNIHPELPPVYTSSSPPAGRVCCMRVSAGRRPYVLIVNPGLGMRALDRNCSCCSSGIQHSSGGVGMARRTSHSSRSCARGSVASKGNKRGLSGLAGWLGHGHASQLQPQRRLCQESVHGPGMAYACPDDPSQRLGHYYSKGDPFQLNHGALRQSMSLTHRGTRHKPIILTPGGV